MERLQKIIAQSGIASRRHAEELIKSGRVKVNGIVVTELGTKVEKNQPIEVDGVRLSKEEPVYFLLYKPRGVVTTASDDKKRKTVVDLIPTDMRIYPVGRLDYDTTGVLLLTNDGTLTNLLTHPKNKIDKVYRVKVKGIAKAEQIIPLQEGVVIDGVKTAPAKVKLRKTDPSKNTSMIEITIHEGRNHQVKKMMQAVGLDVLKLTRIRFAFLTLDGLTSGNYRKLNPKEVKRLYELAQPKKSQTNKKHL